MLALLIDRALAERPAGETLTPVELSRLPPPKKSAARSEMVVFQINLGAKDRAEANWILPLVCRRGAITRREVGAIRVERDRTLFEIAGPAAAAFTANAAEPDPRAPHVRIEPSSAPMPARSLETRPASRPHAGARPTATRPPARTGHPPKRGKPFRQPPRR
jgi:ATP-dependent RNA helicase DeaD